MERCLLLTEVPGCVLVGPESAMGLVMFPSWEGPSPHSPSGRPGMCGGNLHEDPAMAGGVKKWPTFSLGCLPLEFALVSLVSVGAAHCMWPLWAVCTTGWDGTARALLRTAW